MSITKIPQPVYYVIAETYNEDYQINPYAVPIEKFDDLEKAKGLARLQYPDSEDTARWKLEHREGLTRGWVIREDDFTAGRLDNRISVTPPNWWTDEFSKLFEA